MSGGPALVGGRRCAGLPSTAGLLTVSSFRGGAARSTPPRSPSQATPSVIEVPADQTHAHRLSSDHHGIGIWKARVSNGMAFLVLVAAALLEAGGDALVRFGLHAPGSATCLGLILLGYGLVVNAPL